MMAVVTDRRGPARWWWCWIPLACMSFACSSGDGGELAPGPTGNTDTDAVYAPDRVLSVDVELDAHDWDTIRYEGRTASQILSGCDAEGFEYTRVTGTVRVDGQRFENVELRKKGYLGSLSSQRPSLKLDLAARSLDQRYQGADKLTLNNNLQDASSARTCVSYGVFARAGLHAPRCNLAHVTVNGQDLGYYSHVEGVDKPFLEHSFGDDSGNLYEGQGADFREDLLPRFQKKTNEKANDDSDLRALTAALEVPDDALLDALEPLLDLDAFLTYWATEVLVGHWDGYNGNLNNFYVYAAPPEGRFHFIPWGTDGTFEPHAFYPKNALPGSVLAVGELSRRLYGLEGMRDRYRMRLRELLDSTWDEPALLARVQTIADRTAAPQAASDALRQWISQRRTQLAPELDGPPPTWSIPPRDARTCERSSTTISVAFSTTYGGIESYRPDPTGRLDVELQAERQQFNLMLASAGNAPESAQQSSIRVLGRRSDGSIVLVQFSVPIRDLKPGALPTHGLETAGVLIEVPANDPTNFRVLGFVDTGVLALTRAEASPGATIEGSFEGLFTPLIGATAD